MEERYLGESIKKLGFGLMRLPKIGKEEDIEQTKKMVDRFMEKGFTYFDTAYVYDGGKSEMALRDAVVKRYDRDRFVCASKLPLWDAKSHEQLWDLAEESLTRSGVEYFDFYLLHCMESETIGKADSLDAWGFMKEFKAAGKAKHIGFSFHSTADVLEGLLIAHPEVEFVQLQINYKDWEDAEVQSRKCYEVCRKYNKPVIIMEPVKGGALATMAPQVTELFRKAAPERSVASWAIRFAASLEGVITVLSGMSNEAQMDDNLSFMENFEPLGEEEQGIIREAVEIINAIPTIPCTACRYCCDGCPMQINIPGVFRAVNDYKIYANIEKAKWMYNDAVKDGGKAGDCIECGQCEGHCPQHISIIEELKNASELFD